MHADDLLRAAQAVVRRVSDPNIPALAEAYPKLHEMCLAAAADASQATVVLQVLPMMLAQLTAMGTQGMAQEEASRAVYDQLNARYVDHLVPLMTRAPPEASPSADT